MYTSNQTELASAASLVRLKTPTTKDPIAPSKERKVLIENKKSRENSTMTLLLSDDVPNEEIKRNLHSNSVQAISIQTKLFGNNAFQLQTRPHMLRNPYNQILSPFVLGSHDRFGMSKKSTLMLSSEAPLQSSLSQFSRPDGSLENREGALKLRLR